MRVVIKDKIIKEKLNYEGLIFNHFVKKNIKHISKTLLRIDFWY